MTATQGTSDVAIIGGGIVGASIAYHLAGDTQVALLEAESAPGYHATGRSAAVYAPSYGPQMIRALTRGSREFYWHPPPGFASAPLLKERGAMFVARAEQLEELEAFYAEQSAESTTVQKLSAAQARERVPVLAESVVAAAVHDSGAFDIDVDLLLQGFLRGARDAGATVYKNARVAGLHWDGDAWLVTAEDGRRFRARTLVNAAGAWLDEVAALAGAPTVGIEARRRSAFVFEPPEDMSCESWPLTIAIDESWYFKPDTGSLLGSPANADPVPPHDVVAEDMDIVIAVHHIEQNTTLRIHRPKHTWAGLRSFTADGEPVCGFDTNVPHFFWAGAVGGYGIQSAPAFGRLCAELLRGGDVPEDLQAQGLELAALAPQRAGLASASTDVSKD